MQLLRSIVFGGPVRRVERRRHNEAYQASSFMSCHKQHQAVFTRWGPTGFDYCAFVSSNTARDFTLAAGGDARDAKFGQTKNLDDSFSIINQTLDPLLTEMGGSLFRIAEDKQSQRSILPSQASMSGERGRHIVQCCLSGTRDICETKTFRVTANNLSPLCLLIVCSSVAVTLSLPYHHRRRPIAHRKYTVVCLALTDNTQWCASPTFEVTHRREDSMLGG